MVQQVIDIGTGPGVGDGEPLRVAFSKINQNFDELYSGNVTPGTSSSTYVQSVAGKFGPDIQLSVADVSGAVSQGYVANLVSAAVTNAVSNEITRLVDSAPAALDTLKEIADAIQNNPSFAADIQSSIGTKLDKSGGTLSGALFLRGDPTSSNEAANKQYIDTALTNVLTLTTAKANVTDVYAKTDTYNRIEINDGLLLKAGVTSVYPKDQTYTKTEVDAGLSVKSNSADVYTKAETYDQTEVNSRIAVKANSADVYSKSAVDDINATKADLSAVYTKDQTYSVTQADALLSLKANTADVYSQFITNGLLALKADASSVYAMDDVYTKAETDAALYQKADTLSVYTKGIIDAALLGKADSANVYTKDQIDALLLNITQTSEYDWGPIVTYGDDRGFITYPVTQTEDYGSF